MINIIYSADNIGFKCDLCGDVLSSYSSLASHKEQSHSPLTALIEKFFVEELIACPIYVLLKDGATPTICPHNYALPLPTEHVLFAQRLFRYFPIQSSSPSSYQISEVYDFFLLDRTILDSDYSEPYRKFTEIGGNKTQEIAEQLSSACGLPKIAFIYPNKLNF